MVVQIQADGDLPHLVALARGGSLRVSLMVTSTDTFSLQSRQKLKIPERPGICSMISLLNRLAKRKL